MKWTTVPGITCSHNYHPTHEPDVKNPNSHKTKTKGEQLHYQPRSISLISLNPALFSRLPSLARLSSPPSMGTFTALSIPVLTKIHTYPPESMVHGSSDSWALAGYHEGAGTTHIQGLISFSAPPYVQDQRAFCLELTSTDDGLACVFYSIATIIIILIPATNLRLHRTTEFPPFTRTTAFPLPSHGMQYSTAQPDARQSYPTTTSPSTSIPTNMLYYRTTQTPISP